MVGKIFRWLQKEGNSLHETAYLLALFAILSQLLGLVRDRFLAHIYGAGESLDIYYAAFRIPDIIFSLAASLVSIYILVPLLVERLRDRENGMAFLRSIFSFFLIFIFSVSIVAFIVSPKLLSLMYPTIAESERFAELVLLTRLLLLSPILLGLSNFFVSITQLYRRFTLYALSPLLYNCGIIFGILLLQPAFGLKGIILGVILGAALHLGVQLPFIISKRLFPVFTLSLDLRSIRQVSVQSLQRSLGLSVNQLSLLAFTSFASLMTAGSITVLNFSLNLQSVPLSIIGVSYSVALFPTLSKLFADSRTEQFVEKIAVASRHIIFWSLPVMVLFLVLRAHIVRTVLGSGEFDWGATRLTAACLALFTASLVAQNLSLLFIRGYYAAGNTRTPLTLNVSTTAFAVMLSLVSIAAYNRFPGIVSFVEALFKVEGVPGTKVLMIPLAYTAAAWVNFFLFSSAFRRDFKEARIRLFKNAAEVLLASLVMGVVTRQSLRLMDDIFGLETTFSVFLHGFLSGLAGIASAVFILYIFKSQELTEVLRTLHRKILRAEGVFKEQETL